MSAGPDTGLDELRRALIDCLESLADTLLGPRNLARSNRRAWRWGRKGSLALEVSGRKRGLWKSHEADVGGDPLQLIMHVRRCSFREAVRWARAWIGLPEGERRIPDEFAKRERELKRAAEEREEAADEELRIAGARLLWASAGAVAGTTAEVYLTKTRKIPRPAAGWPDAVRYHAATNSLMLAVTTADGALQAVQRVHLTRDAKKIEASPGRLPKQTNGVLRDAVVRLPGDPSRPLLVAEGPETGLSAWATTGYETWVCLGGIARLTPPMGRHLVICRDDDPQWSDSDRKHRKTVKTWRQQGIDLAVVTPWPERRHNKTDLNDTLKDRGADAVRARIEAALQPASGRRRLPKEDARRVLAGGIARFNAAFHAYERSTPRGRCRRHT